MDDEEIIRTNSYLKWIMFYTDVEHRVEPVLSGTRMVLQYDVMIAPPSSPKKRKFDELDEYGAERDIFQSYQISEKYQSSLININDHLISQIPLCVKEIFNSAANETDDDKCGVAFSCAYLYTVQTIEPDHLKDIDRSIFDGFLQSPEGFVIGLAPILLRTYCSKDGYFGDFSTRFKILPPFKVYERSPVDGTISISICREVPPDTIAYYQTGSELVEMVDNIPHLAYTGNESQHGMNEYRSVAFVVFEKKTKANATRKQKRHQKKKR